MTIPRFRPARNGVFKRYATVLLLAFWMGGFTFYAEIVIPTATRVLGSERQVGFITEQVTNWLNLIGIVPILFFLWNVAAEWSRQPRLRRLGLLAMWVVMALAHTGLFLTHPLMDRLLNPQTRTVHDYEHFVNLHAVYLTFATTEWTAALVYLWLMFLCWRHTDRENAAQLRAAEVVAETNIAATTSRQ